MYGLDPYSHHSIGPQIESNPVFRSSGHGGGLPKSNETIVFVIVVGQANIHERQKDFSPSTGGICRVVIGG